MCCLSSVVIFVCSALCRAFGVFLLAMCLILFVCALLCFLFDASRCVLFVVHRHSLISVRCSFCVVCCFCDSCWLYVVCCLARDVWYCLLLVVRCSLCVTC